MAEQTKQNTAILTDEQAEIAALLTDSLANLAAGMGTGKDKRSYTFFNRGNNRGINGQTQLGAYGFSLSQRRIELESMYETDMLSGKIVDIPPEDMLRQWRTMDFGGNEELKKQFIEAEEELGLREQFEEALKWSRLYGGAGIIMGINGAGDSSLPLDIQNIPRGGLKYLKTLDQWFMIPQDIEYYDISKYNYFRPRFYRLSGTSQLVHHSRMIRFDGNKMPRAISKQTYLWGDSVLVRLEDPLINAASAPNLVASLLYEASIDVMQVEGLIAKLGSRGGEVALQKRFAFANLVKSTYNMLILDSKETYDKKSPSLAGLVELITKYDERVSAGSDIPVARLFGRALGGLNSTGEQDIRNYYDGLKSKQESILRPAMTKADHVIMMSLWGRIPEEYSWKFNPLWQLTDKEQAETNLIVAQRDEIYLTQGVITPEVVAKELQTNGTYENIDDAFLEAIDEKFVTSYGFEPKQDIQETPDDHMKVFGNLEEHAQG